MKKLLVLCREPRLYSCQRLKQAAEKAGFAMDILDPNRFLLKVEQGKLTAYYQTGESYHQNRSLPQPIAEYAGVIGRFGTASTAMGCRVLRHFELQGIPTLNSANAFELARDKWQSLQVLAAAGIPVPPTVIGGDLVSSEGIATQISSSTVLKTLSGSQGVGVMLAENAKTAQAMRDTLTANQIPTLTQTFIPEAKGQDIRAFVIGDKVVAAMQRQGKAGDFRANIHQGGSATKITLSDNEKAIAIQATQALGLDVAGVDLIQSPQGTMVLEVNASAGLEMIEKVSGVAIAEMMVAFLKEKIETERHDERVR